MSEGNATDMNGDGESVLYITSLCCQMLGQFKELKKC